MTRNKLNKLYDANRIKLTETAVWSLNFGMQSWSQRNPWAEPEKRNKALRRKTVDLCLACPECYEITEDIPDREEPCRLDIPREHYVKKIEEYLEKKDKASASHYRARLKYYDNHITEATEMVEFKKDCLELASWKKVFKESKRKRLWHECRTIEKMVKEKGIEAKPAVKHALEVIHKHFAR